MTFTKLVAVLVAFAPQLASAAEAEPMAAPPTAAQPAETKATEPKPTAPEDKPAPAEPRVTLEVPLFSEEFADVPVAMVDDEIIGLRELRDSLATSHQSHKSDSASRKKDFTALLDRMIDARLLAFEGYEMGIDDLEDTKAAFEGFEERLLMQMLQQRAVKDVTADPAVADRLYKDAVRQWKIKSALFPRKEDAEAARKAVAAGRSFDEVVTQAVAEKKADGGDEAQFVGPDKLLPEVLAAVQKLEAGGVSEPVRVATGHALMRVEEIGYPADEAKRSEAEAAALQEKRKAALQKYYEALVKKHATLNRKLVEQIDLEKKPLQTFAKDKRVLARFKGEKPITVAELATELSGVFFHGADQAAQGKRVNPKKMQQFDALVSKRIVSIESRAQALRDTDEFKRRVGQYRTSVMFNRVIEKVIVPDITVKEEEIQKYYEAHKAEYMLPAMYKLQGIGFANVKDAQAAHDKLRAGTDFKWLKANAERQLADEQRIQAIEAATTLSARAMPAELAKSLSTAAPGDYRLFTPSEKVAYVVQVLDNVPEQPQPLEGELHDKISSSILVEKVGNAIKERADKLREFHKVQVFITGVGN